MVSAPAWDGTGCEIDSWQCWIYIPCSLSLRLLGSLRGSLGTYGLPQKLCHEKNELRRRNSTAAEEVTRSSVSPQFELVWLGRTSGHQKLVPTFKWIDSCPMVTKQDFLGNGMMTKCTLTERDIQTWKCRRGGSRGVQGECC